MNQFIESVKKYPCLWKVDTKEYYMKECTDEAWENVIRECNIKNVKKAQESWKLIQHYSLLWLKANNTFQDVSSRSMLKKMEFAIPYLHGPSTSSILLNTSTESQVNTSEVKENEENIINLEANENDKEQQTPSEFRNKRTYDRMTELLEHAQKKKKYLSLEKDSIRIAKSFEKLRKERYMKKFFMSMCEMNFGLPEILQMKIQRQLFNSVMEAREENIHLQKKPSRSATAFKMYSKDKTSDSLNSASASAYSP